MFRYAVGVAALALAVGLADPAAAQRVRAGVLTCDISAGIGLIIGSQKSVACTFAPEPAGPALRLVSPLTLGVVAEKLGPARHAESACRLSRSPASRFDTIWETPSAPMVTP